MTLSVWGYRTPKRCESFVFRFVPLRDESIVSGATLLKNYSDQMKIERSPTNYSRQCPINNKKFQLIVVIVHLFFYWLITLVFKYFFLNYKAMRIKKFYN